MKSNRKLTLTAAIIVLFGSLLTSCGQGQAASNPQIGAINTLRTQLEIPKLPLEYIETTLYANSPSSSLQVEVYQDTAGRKFYVDPVAIQVVEMDARALLDKISPFATVMSEDQIRTKAQRLIAAAIPGFETLQANWVYEEGGKIDNYFYSWYGESLGGQSNRPFAQIALHRTGLLFAYYNTLMLDK